MSICLGSLTFGEYHFSFDSFPLSFSHHPIAFSIALSDLSGNHLIFVKD
jgi:hypothetical protein